MPLFQYQALDAKGNESKGQIEALSSKEAISKIPTQTKLILIRRS